MPNRRIKTAACVVAGGLVLTVIVVILLTRGGHKPSSSSSVAHEPQPEVARTISPQQDSRTSSPPSPVGPGASRTENVPAVPAPPAKPSPPPEPSPADVFRNASPAVVRVVALGPDGTRVGQGSGFFISPDGKVVTNYHVIENAAAVEVLLVNNARFPLQGVVGLSKDEDLAILKVDATDVPYLKISSPGSPEVGTTVHAIGSPQGLTNSFSSGQVSGLRKLADGFSLIQCTAPISPGSSGGPLVDKHGQVVGITTFYFAQGQNLNFAIPAGRTSSLISRTAKLQTLDEALHRPTRTATPLEQKDPPRWALDLPYEARIEFNIAADARIRGVLQGYFLRELRKINGVVITDSKPRWEVSVVALPQEAYDGSVVGYNMSIVVFQISQHFDPANPWFTTTRGEIVKHALMYRGISVLEDGVKKTVAEMEGEIVENDRKVYEFLREYARKAKEKGKQQ